jgi:cytochrome c556
MSVLNKHWQACKIHLEKGDFAAAGKALDQMQTSLTGLDTFKPHKNAEKMEEFRSHTGAFRENVAKLREAAKGRNNDVVRDLSTTVDSGCIQCHGTFR